MERAGLIGAVRMRKLDTDDKGALRGPTLQAAILEDKARGLLPFFVSEIYSFYLCSLSLFLAVKFIAYLIQ